MQRSSLFLTVSSVSFSHSLFSTSCPVFYLTYFSLFCPSHFSYSLNYVIFSSSVSSFLTPIFLSLISHLSCYPSLALLHLQIYIFFSFAFSSSSIHLSPIFTLISLWVYASSPFVILFLILFGLSFPFCNAFTFFSFSLSTSLQPTISLLGLCVSSQSPSLFHLFSETLWNEVIQMAFYGAVQHNQAEHGRQS